MIGSQHWRPGQFTASSRSSSGPIRLGETLWLNFAPTALQNVLETLPAGLFGSDTDFRVLRLPRENAEAAGVTPAAFFETANVRDLQSRSAVRFL